MNYQISLTFIHQKLAHVKVTEFSGHVETSESILVLNGCITSTLNEHVNDVNHVFFNCSMHRCIKADLLIFLNIGIASVMQKRFNHRLALSLHSEMEWGLPIDISGVDIHLVVV